MKKIINKSGLGALAAMTALAIFTQCHRAPDPVIEVNGFAQGGTYNFVLKTSDTVGLQRQIDSVLLVMDNSTSMYVENSLINRINRNETDSLDTIIADCIRLALRASAESDGLYDITIKPITEAWGFSGGQYKGQPNIDSLLQYVGYDKIRIEDGRLVKSNPGVKLDLESIAQGYTADLLAQLMDSRGIKDYMVEIGGELYAKGLNAKRQPWRIGVDRPIEGNFLPGEDLQVVIAISDKGMATAGNYRRYYLDDEGRKVVHTINPKTGLSAISNLLSATVVAESGAVADAYATVMMVSGLEKAKQFLSERDDLMGYLVYSDSLGNYNTYYSPDLKKMIKKQ